MIEDHNSEQSHGGTAEQVCDEEQLAEEEALDILDEHVEQENEVIARSCTDGEQPVSEESNTDIDDVITQTTNQITHQQSTEDVGLIDKALIDELKQFVVEQRNQIQSMFENKLAYDATKQAQVDSLHEELQKYKKDLIAKTARPLINDLIKMHDDLGKLVDRLRQNPQDVTTQEQTATYLSDFQEDIEVALDRNGVSSFRADDEKFNPRFQQVIKKVETGDREVVGHVVNSVRPGFEQGADMIRKEKVSVYVLQPEIETQEKSNPL